MASRDTRSEALDAEDLLAQHGAWMRRFAAALAGAEGEELVQETWLRVLGSRGLAVRHTRGWLARVMRNVATTRGRSEQRRRRREEDAARPEAQRSGAGLVAQAELEQAALRAVLGLSPSYREVLLLRFAQGQEPSEIARDLGLSASTVRTRIARGLEQVRRRLDQEHGGERSTWLGLLLLPGRDTGTVAKRPPLAPESNWVQAGAGGLLMASGVKWMATCVTVLALALSVWVARSQEALDAAPPRGAEDGGSRLQAPIELSQRPSAPQDTPSSETRVAVDGALGDGVGEPALAASLTVRVTWERNGGPAAGLPLQITSWDADPYPQRHSLITDDAGEARFEALSAGRQHVNTLHGAGGWVAVGAGEAEVVEFAIPPGLDVHCSVVDPNGDGVAGAQIWLSDDGSESDGAVIGRTDPAGRFLAKDVPIGGHHLAARSDRHGPSSVYPVAGSVDDRLELTLLLPAGPGASLAGRVLDPLGRPVAGADVLLSGLDGQGERPGEHDSTLQWQWLRTDPQGRFHGRGLTPGSLSVAVRARGLAPLRELVDLDPGRVTSEAFRLEPEAGVQGVVQDATGKPLAGVLVSGGGRYLEFPWVRTSSGLDGSFSLGGLTAGRQELRASDPVRGSARATLVLSADSIASWDAVLESGALVAGRVLDERDQPLVNWHVAAVTPTDPGLWLREQHTDGQGRFRLPNCPAPPFVLAVRSPDEVFGVPLVLCDDFRPGQEDLVLRVPDAAHPSGYLEGRLVASDGSTLVMPRLSYSSSESRAHLPVRLESGGGFRIGPLRPGEYSLQAQAEGMAELQTPLHRLEPGAELDLGTLTLEPSGFVHVRARLPKDEAWPAGFTGSILGDRATVGYVRFDGPQGSSDPLAPGRYLLRLRSGFWCAPYRTVDVVAGQVTMVEADLRRAACRTLQLVVPAADPASRLSWSVRGADGAEVLGGELSVRRHNRFTLELEGILPGAYALEATSDSGLHAADAFEVLGWDPQPDPLIVPLR